MDQSLPLSTTVHFDFFNFSNLFFNFSNSFSNFFASSRSSASLSTALLSADSSFVYYKELGCGGMVGVDLNVYNNLRLTFMFFWK